MIASLANDLITQITQILAHHNYAFSRLHVLYCTELVTSQLPLLLSHTHAELEGFFYSVVSLFHIVTPDQANGIVQSFCDKLAAKDNEENINLRLRL